MTVDIISYGRVSSPWGALLLAATEAGVCFCHFEQGGFSAHLLTRLQQQRQPCHLQRDEHILAPAVALLQQYFSGRPEKLSYPLDLRGTPFQLQVWAALRRIPPGQVASYGEIAACLGRPQAARAVGQACRRNPVVLFVPCHRVVAARGRLGGFAAAPALKKALLGHEGLDVDGFRP